MTWKPTLLRMREGKPGGGKGPLLSEDMSLTLTGNGVVAPVAEWIGRRLMEALA